MVVIPCPKCEMAHPNPDEYTKREPNQRWRLEPVPGTSGYGFEFTIGKRGGEYWKMHDVSEKYWVGKQASEFWWTNTHATHVMLLLCSNVKADEDHK